ncbi:hypothetical protein QBC36DRAFT_358521 [Triangularia setosa]|uniref:Uncharacterized protein n=1 Tax=Triangularia setosa TaxID=2587417 RepID=A0AAN6W2J7_9PEZI|nr:hypothetical protein QBC36DRAFT_358521 [Podospora setosa]
MSGRYPQTPPHPALISFTPHEVDMWTYGFYVLLLPDYVDPRLKEVRGLLEDAISKCDEYRENSNDLGNHDTVVWPRDWTTKDFEDQDWWTELQLLDWIEEAIFAPAQSTPVAPAAHAIAAQLSPQDPAVAQRAKDEEAHNLQKHFRQWLGTRSAAYQARVNSMSQHEYKAVWDRWSHHRRLEERQELCIRELLTLKVYESQYRTHQRVKPPYNPPGPYFAWSDKEADIRKRYPFQGRDDYIKGIKNEVENWRLAEFNDFIKQQPRKIQAWVQSQIQRVQAQNKMFSIAEIQNIQRQTQAYPIQIPPSDTPIRKRIRMLQKQIWRQNWHHGLLVNIVRGLPAGAIPPSGIISTQYKYPAPVPTQSPPFTPFTCNLPPHPNPSSAQLIPPPQLSLPAQQKAALNAQALNLGFRISPPSPANHPPPPLPTQQTQLQQQAAQAQLGQATQQQQ